jgi:BlaI family transcriptional regulator, penicillinase repressor
MTPEPSALSRRERQLMDVLYRLGRATVAEVRAEIEDAPSYSTVRALLGVLESKGHVKHEAEGLRYVYQPTIPRDQVRNRALMNVIQTFFEGSTTQAMAALLNTKSRPSPQELEQLSRMIEKARKEGR